MTRLLLLFSFVLPAFPQSVPSGAVDLPLPEFARFMEIVCPGHHDAQTCAVCPPESGRARSSLGWQLVAITFGHFTAPQAKEALMSTQGCASHAEGWGGSFLLRDDGRGYQKVWYRGGYSASDCKKLKASDGRDVLICEAGDMHFGVGDEYLYLLDLNWIDPDTHWPTRLFFLINDTLASCVTLDGYAVIGYIDAVKFSTEPGSGKIGIAVTAHAGKALLPPKVLDDCNLNSKPLADEYKPVIATKSLLFRFTFDGSNVRPVPDNPPLNGIEPTVPVTSYYVPKAGHPVKLRR